MGLRKCKAKSLNELHCPYQEVARSERCLPPVEKCRRIGMYQANDDDDPSELVAEFDETTVFGDFNMERLEKRANFRAPNIQVPGIPLLTTEQLEFLLRNALPEIYEFGPIMDEATFIRVITNPTYGRLLIEIDTMTLILLSRANQNNSLLASTIPYHYVLATRVSWDDKSMTIVDFRYPTTEQQTSLQAGLRCINWRWTWLCLCSQTDKLSSPFRSRNFLSLLYELFKHLKIRYPFMVESELDVLQPSDEVFLFTISTP